IGDAKCQTILIAAKLDVDRIDDDARPGLMPTDEVDPPLGTRPELEQHGVVDPREQRAFQAVVPGPPKDMYPGTSEHRLVPRGFASVLRVDQRVINDAMRPGHHAQ